MLGSFLDNAGGAWTRLDLRRSIPDHPRSVWKHLDLPKPILTILDLPGHASTSLDLAEQLRCALTFLDLPNQIIHYLGSAKTRMDLPRSILDQPRAAWTS